jgi:hypothetical protein
VIVASARERRERSERLRAPAPSRWRAPELTRNTGEQRPMSDACAPRSFPFSSSACS